MPKAYAKQTITAEGYGPCGTAVIIDCVVDSAALIDQVRSVLLQHGGRVGAANSVAYLFHRVGLLRCPATSKLPATAYAAGAEDVTQQPDGSVEVCTDPADLDAVRQQLQAAGHAILSSTVTRRAARSLPLTAGDAQRLQDLLTELRALVGVESVYTNGQIPEQFLARV